VTAKDKTATYPAETRSKDDDYLARLKESEARFRALCENAPVIIFTLDNDGIYTYVNPTWQNILGHEPAEVIGRHYSEFVRQDDIAHHENLCNRIQQNNETLSDVACELVAKDGTIFRFAMNGSPNRDDLGQVTGVVGFFRDITYRRRVEKKLRAQTELAEQLIENAPEAIVVLSNDDRVIRINREFTRVFGYTPEEAEGRSINDLVVPEELKEEGLSLTQRTAQGERIEMETQRCHKNGTLIDVSVLGTPIRIKGDQVGIYAIYRDISARKIAEAALAESQAKYGAILDHIEEGYYEIDLKGNIIFATETTARIVGVERDYYLGRNYAEFCDEENAKALYKAFNAIYNTGLPSKHINYTVVTPDGRRKVLEASAGLMLDSQGQPIGFRGIVRDVTTRKQAEDALRASEQRHRAVLETSPDPVMVLDLDNKVTYLNPAFTRVFGWNLEECRGKELDFVPPENRPEMWEIIEKVKHGRSFSGLETRRLTKNGQIVDVSISGAVFVDGQSRPLGSVMTLQDITERKKAEEELRYVAYHDLLTGLPNRKSFYLRLEDMVIQSRRRGEKETWALLFLDLDRFKHINDTLGHDVGDQLLQAVAQRVRSCLRDSDHMFRLGGDEFTVILTFLARGLDVAKVARKIRREVAKPYQIEGIEVFTSASIGISVYPTDGQEVEVLMKNADMAMYAAKEEGVGYRFFTAEMNRRALERMQLESNIRRALDRDEFVLFYQPVVGEGDRILGMEALVRWEHPELGLVPPSKFITVAEETGAIEPLGRWVLDTACRWAIRLHQNGYQYLFVTVNLSPRQFKDPDLLDSVVKTLNETGLPPTALKLEITESCVMDDPEEAIEKMKALRDMGIGFSIDDFGTGYSSLSYLKRFPIDTLKIDRSFVMESLTNRDDQEIIRTIISMAQNLRIQTVAEGVESKEQRDFLLSLGCSIMQGYYFGRPMPDRDFEKLLSNHSSTR
jgi:diguanylate cyclase (GGDEF)-like protein/PAS domain S-box-containing protein